MQNPDDLKQIQIFQTLPEPILNKIFAAGIFRNILSGHLLFQEGDGVDSAFFVLSGQLQAVRGNLEGREQVITTLSAGQVCNLPAVFTGKPAVSTVIALEDSQVFLITAVALQELAQISPDLSLAVMKALSIKLQYFNELAYDLSLRSVRARLAKFLLEKQDQPDGLTQSAMASQIGTVREVISRTLRSFVKEGFIKFDRHEMKILDEAGLLKEMEK